MTVTQNLGTSGTAVRGQEKLMLRFLRKVIACNKSATDRRKHTIQNNFQSQPLKICFSAKRKFPFRRKYSVSIKILNRPK